MLTTLRVARRIRIPHWPFVISRYYRSASHRLSLVHEISIAQLFPWSGEASNVFTRIRGKRDRDHRVDGRCAK